MHKTKRTKIAGIIITIIILIIVVIVSNIEVNNLSHIESAFGKVVMPIQNGLTYLKNKMAGNNTFFTDINNLKEENEKLKEENSKLEQSLRELEILKSENSTLKEYVNLKDKYTEYETVPAYVINKDISNYNDTIIINVGSKDGIEVNMPVIADQGLVGHIISVTETTSKVQTIVDTSSTISCTMTTTRDNLIARGSLEAESTLKATYIPTEANVLQGEKLETSGLGGIYPKGIHVGKIKEVIETKNITNRYAIIETAVDFTKIEAVLVITK
ncbi:MAG: rod shape-determining protein MreC [Clostridia bacterium]|nr:rod shape-determining protein MreC [Clostridia bacterium]